MTTYIIILVVTLFSVVKLAQSGKAEAAGIAFVVGLGAAAAHMVGIF